jgi:hypothetical protein
MLRVLKVKPSPFSVNGRVSKVLCLFRVMGVSRVFKVKSFPFPVNGRVGKVF